MPKAGVDNMTAKIPMPALQHARRGGTDDCVDRFTGLQFRQQASPSTRAAAARPSGSAVHKRTLRTATGSLICS
jgi:hypothetical protein